MGGANKLERSLRAYTIIVSLIGAAIVLWALANLPADWPGLLVLAGLAAVAEWTNVELFPATRSRVSVSSVVALASMLLFGPCGGALTHAVSGITTAFTTALQKTDLEQTGRVSLLQRTAFNIGMFVISVAAAGTAYTAVGGSVGQVALASNIFPLILAVATDHVVNIGLLVGAISLQAQRPPLRIWREDFSWGAPIAITAGVAGGAALALGYQLFRFLGLAVFLLPVLLVRYSYWLYVQQTKVMREILKNANT